ncbi:aspartate kinase [Bdellovibrio bacteriovorus]|uniref:Aspartokinase n=1 Tax=Bdellovibrio bacteriovorus TaxID=959 RepID=A0A150WRL3_BDEBC|nr:aspartate kinase [Bdellovibrio bacteriovorus]KYG67153.1 aspartate kinase [Bdellovibrio bacteriovorus]
MKPLIVQKYGGATLADPDKIKSVAARVCHQAQENSLLVVVSAMGKTTNSLIDLANQVSQRPHRREMDMLLTVGERISMSLMSMALNDLGCSAISFTGSQAGIFTDDSHVNAFIKDVKPIRIAEALQKDKVVILAGFQGVSPQTKEITTLGRGGSDTSAVAMAAAFNAERCEILKDVPAVFTADPNIVKTAKPLKELNYDQLMEMTFWGAKVLHYRSVELAKIRNVTLYIGPASNKTSDGTLVKKGLNMFESSKALSLNSHELVLSVHCHEKNPAKALRDLQHLFNEKQIAFPQMLQCSSENGTTEILLTGPQEIMIAMKRELKGNKNFVVQDNEYSTVTLTCTGATSPELVQQVLDVLHSRALPSEKILMSAMSMTIMTSASERKAVIESLHSLIQA